MVRFTLGLPLRVTPENSDAVARLTGTLNSRMGVCGFMFGEEIRFGIYALLNHDGTLSSEVLDRSMAMCTMAAEMHLDDLQRIADGEASQ